MNPQDRTALAIAATLAASGVRHVVASPGSRHTPLLLALDNHPDLSVSMHHDERSAGFFALGVGKATEAPAVLVCTSGSAVGHYLPAVIEADLSTTPMIIVSADRPHELWGSGAPQTINQREIFGSTVRAYESIDSQAFGDSSNTTINTRLRTHWRCAAAPTPGPVHLNIEFREPLLPGSGGPETAEVRSPGVRTDSAEHHGTDLGTPIAALAAAGHPLIVAGRLSRKDSAAVTEFAEHLGAPVFADPQSGLRSPGAAHTIAYADLLAEAGALERDPPDIVIRVGPLPTSKPVWTWLGDHAEIPQYVIVASGRHDPMGSATGILVGDIAATLDALRAELPSGANDYRDLWIAHDEVVAAALTDEISGATLTEPSTASTVATTSTTADYLVVASSMPIRDLDVWGGRWNAVRTIANRGANGIDGIISTALGVAVSAGRHTLAYIGDVAALHDVGSLATVARLAPDLTILVVNNDGGGIFHHLAQADPTNLDPNRFERLFGTPHGLSIATLATAFGIETSTVKTPNELHMALSARSGTPRLIEVHTSRAEAAEERHRLRSLVSDLVR